MNKVDIIYDESKPVTKVSEEVKTQIETLVTEAATEAEVEQSTQTENEVSDDAEEVVLTEAQKNALAYTARTGKLTPEAKKVLDTAHPAIVTESEAENTTDDEKKVEVENPGISVLELENAKLKAVIKYGLSEDDALFLDGASPESIDAKAQLLKDRLGVKRATKRQPTEAAPTIRRPESKVSTPKDEINHSIAEFIKKAKKEYGM